MQNSILSIVLTTAILASCNSKKANNQRVSTPGTPREEIVIHRYEKALFTIDQRNLKAGLKNIYPEYAFFLGKEWEDTMNVLRIYNYMNDPNIRELYKLEAAKFPDVGFLKKGLEDAYSLYRKIYPEKPLPKVYTYISGLDIDRPIVFADTAMAVSMDLFLGSDVIAYAKAGIPEYKIERFTSDHILPVCMLTVAKSLISTDENKMTLLDQMVAAGKALYFLDVTLPEVKDEDKIGYSAAQMEWCKRNDGNIWSFLIANQLFYSSDPRATGKLIVDAPFTSGFVTESPGRLGEWIGWQIVRAYMEENPSTSLRDLMENTDAQSILKGSNYKPSKS